MCRFDSTFFYSITKCVWFQCLRFSLITKEEYSLTGYMAPITLFMLQNILNNAAVDVLFFEIFQLLIININAAFTFMHIHVLLIFDTASILMHNTILYYNIIISCIKSIMYS